ncbi:stage V sporulation protein AC [Desulfothermobacter acidiphilus]|uniref:stage V sporulation protein AC n=1 Tax=Desulfothermobacter acidiphilus TaxID=1938353 RepID=UPI003F8ADECF
MRVFDPSQPLEIQKRQYQQMVNRTVPRPLVWRNCLWAFATGGLICLMGQAGINLWQRAGLSFTDAATATSIVLVFLAAFFTGLGYYDELARYAGAGMLVPITGFANAMVAPALEARTEGLVLGVGARLFAVAGPILVFGIVTAWLSGLIYYLLGPRPPLAS